MIFEFDSMDTYHQAVAVDPGLIGTPPVDAAYTLGISRQGVHIAIKRGFLDAVKVEVKRGRPIFMVTKESIKRYSETPARGRPPKILPEGESAYRWKNYKAYSIARCA